MTSSEGEIASIKFDALRNAIYHGSRRSYLDLLNRLLNFLVIVLGAGVAGKAADLFHVKELWLELSVLVVATAQLSFDFSFSARTHEFLQKKYYELLADLESDPAPDAKKLRTKMFTIASDEPMPKRAVDALAYNAVIDATSGDPKYRASNRVHVPLHHLLLRHVFAFNGHEYQLERDHVWWGLRCWRSMWGDNDKKGREEIRQKVREEGSSEEDGKKGA